MDDIVKQAMNKWPNVPHCYGWLGLDARGNWYMRDEAVQSIGRFSSGKVGARGALLKHEKLIKFIQRNYACTVEGEWYFQNGPQRVYVELEATPWVWRLDSDLNIVAHSGETVQYYRVLADEYGWVYLETNLGFGLVHTQDVAQAASAIESGRWTLAQVLKAELESTYRYVKSPQGALQNSAQQILNQ